MTMGMGFDLLSSHSIIVYFWFPLEICLQSRMNWVSRRRREGFGFS